VVRAAMARFSVLCGRIRQQKCAQYGQQLLPILLQLMGRQDDSLQVSGHVYSIALNNY